MVLSLSGVCTIAAGYEALGSQIMGVNNPLRDARKEKALSASRRWTCMAAAINHR